MNIYLDAVLSSLAAWFIGMVIDANIDFGPDGFLCLRIVLPIIVMGLFIIKNCGNSKNNNIDKDKEEELK